MTASTTDNMAADRPLTLLTGVTGFLGCELLARWLTDTNRDVALLVRARDDEHAAQRARDAVRCALGEVDGDAAADRVVVLRGDLTAPGLGLHGRAAERLAARVDEIVHGAASVSFELDLPSSRAINVEGTRRMLDFAQRCAALGDGLRRFAYVSTAYVAGDHHGPFAEGDAGGADLHRNPYERSKWEAERLVCAHRDLLPITVFRPSIVVGDHETGWTPEFNVLYWPLRAFARGTYHAVPADPHAPVDVVPVDYVADAIFSLTREPDDRAGTYHLTAGGDASTVGELLALGARRFDRPAPTTVPPGLYRRFVHPALMATSSGRTRRLLHRSEVFFPYFAMDVRYDDSCARRALAPRGIACAPLSRYFDRLLDYAELTRWGKDPMSRAEARYAPALPA